MKRAARRSKAHALGHILVVEDDAVLALSIEQSLLDAGAEAVTISPTAAETIAALRKARPDAVILDVHLADSDDGWEIAELIDTIGPNPPRIVFSTGSPEDIPKRIAELGKVLTKPYDPDELIELLRQPQPRGLLSRLRRRA